MNTAIRQETNTRQEVQAAARWLALKGYRGEAGDPLPGGISEPACKRIAADLTGFQQMVRASRC